jgi:hypothetical protein
MYQREKFIFCLTLFVEELARGHYRIRLISGLKMNHGLFAEGAKLCVLVEIPYRKSVSPRPARIQTIVIFDNNKALVLRPAVVVCKGQQNCVLVTWPILVEPALGVFRARRLQIVVGDCLFLFDLRFQFFVLFL